MTDALIREEIFGPLAGDVEGARAELTERDARSRLRSGDHTLWSDDPTEIADRLGWLPVVDEMRAEGDALDRLREQLRADGFTHALVMGMGGSSLFPEVLASSEAPSGDGLRLGVLDSTHPEAVAHALASFPPDRTLFIASSKSGGTIETRSQLEFFWERVGRGEAFAAITDAGSELAELGAERGFRAVFLNRSDIGGRYSALSHFGLVPAALADPGWRGMLERAASVVDRLDEDEPHPGERLGAFLAAAVRSGRDKVTFVMDPRLETFGLWLEQLLAESTGKDGTGVIPIVGERIGPVDVYGDDRVIVVIGEPEHPIGPGVLAEAGHPTIRLGFDGRDDLGTQVVLWEIATALCGALLGINPFDQPNVAEAKKATDEVLRGDRPAPPASEGDLDRVLASVRPGDYLAIQAFVDPGSEDARRLQEVRLALRSRYRVATTFGIGPRFLHSTGQLHKGGPPSGVFLQVVDDAPNDLDVPGRPFGFGRLLRSQADGDLSTLRAHRLRAARTGIDALEDRLGLDRPTR